MKDFGNPANIDGDALAFNLAKLVEIYRHDHHECENPKCEGIAGLPGFWRCTSRSGRTSQVRCFTCALAAELSGWLCDKIETYAQRAARRRYEMAGIGTN